MRPAPDPHPAALDRAAVRAEMDQARADFRRLVSDATPADLRRPSDGTRWTNQQLLFHMLFGYLIVRALLILARIFGLLPGRGQQGVRQAAGLRAAAVPPDQLPRLVRWRPPHPARAHAPGARPRHRGPRSSTWNERPKPRCAAACTTRLPGTRSSPAT